MKTQPPASPRRASAKGLRRADAARDVSAPDGVAGLSALALDAAYDAVELALDLSLPADARLVHVVPITIVTPSEFGPFDELFTITIRGRSDPLTFRAQGRIIAPVSPSAN